MPFGTDAAAERIEAIKAALKSFADDTAIHDIHNVRVRETEAGEIVNFHCRAAPAMSVTRVHENVDEIERALRRALPDHEARHQPRRAAARLTGLRRLPFSFRTSQVAYFQVDSDSPLDKIYFELTNR